MKLHGEQLVVVDADEQNSPVVLDIPIDSNTMVPPALGVPLVSSGAIAWALARPAAACAAGSLLLPPEYRPPANPLYVLVPSCVNGIRPTGPGSTPLSAVPLHADAAPTRMKRTRRTLRIDL